MRLASGSVQLLKGETGGELIEVNGAGGLSFARGALPSWFRKEAPRSSKRCCLLGRAPAECS